MKTPDERRAIKRRAAQVFLDEVHTRNCRVLPTRERMLELLPSAAIVAEVGVAFGDFTREIIKRAAPAKLHLIDAWSSERYREGLLRIREEFAEALTEGRIEINQ